MSVANITSGDHILDVKGQLLIQASEVVLKSLDKALTLEAYYSSTHEQYVLATNEAAQAISLAVRSRGTMTLHLTAEGLLILDQTVAPEQRHVKQLMSLLVPLNVAQLELDATLSPGDLRQALDSLHAHRRKVKDSEGFREVVIRDMPPTIRATSRSVLREQESPPAREHRPAPADPNESEGEKLARRFLTMVNEVLQNLKNLGVADLNNPIGAQQVSLSEKDLEDLRLSLKRLLEFNPTPRELTELIGHARQALELSRDPYRTDMVFQILRRDILHKGPVGPESRGRALRGQTEYSLSLDELTAAIAELESQDLEVSGPLKDAGRAQLVICLTMLQDNPTEAVTQSIHSCLVTLFKSPGFRFEDLEPCLEAVGEALDGGFLDWVAILLETITTTLRQGRSSLLGPFWAALAERTDEADLEMVWPFLVNDILGGFGRHNRQEAGRALAWAGTIKPSSARRLIPELEKLGALDREKGARDLFTISPVKVLPVLQALAQTQLGPWIGKGLYVSMRSRPMNNLVKALMEVVDYHPSMLEFYLDLVAQPVVSSMSGRLRDRAAFLLLETLDSLPRTEREAAWVPAALQALADLQVNEALEFFEKVVGERRLMFGHGWPQGSRNIAAAALQAKGVSHG